MVEHCYRRPIKVTGNQHAGRVDPYIDATEAFYGADCQPFDVVRVGDTRWHQLSLTAEALTFVDDIVQGFDVPSRHESRAP